MEEYKLKKFNKCLAVAKNIKDSVYVISFLQQQFKLGIGSTHTHTHTHKHFKNGWIDLLINLSTVLLSETSPHLEKLLSAYEVRTKRGSKVVLSDIWMKSIQHMDEIQSKKAVRQLIFVQFFHTVAYFNILNILAYKHYFLNSTYTRFIKIYSLNPFPYTFRHETICILILNNIKFSKFWTILGKHLFNSTDTRVDLYASIQYLNIMFKCHL